MGMKNGVLGIMCFQGLSYLPVLQRLLSAVPFVILIRYLGNSQTKGYTFFHLFTYKYLVSSDVKSFFLHLFFLFTENFW